MIGIVTVKPSLPKRPIRLAALWLLALPALCIFLYSGLISNQYLHTLPRQPNPDAHRVYPRNIHGIVVFQTYSEREYLDALCDGSIAAFFVGLILLGFEDALWRKRNPKQTAPGE